MSAPTRRALFALPALASVCGCRRSAEPAPVTARFGVFFGGQIQEREEIPLVGYAEAEAASTSYPGFGDHPFRTCFVCGPHRAAGEGIETVFVPVDSSDAGALDFYRANSGQSSSATLFTFSARSQTR